ncbi:hypothetical protein [Ruegeria arenilitoris]|uniref:hypothetical protein n=1 Tax=Ruegeria arenilitoris TaxID=1173585 RepID=UPI00147F287B|nr:hypothetical protein [Ruegeria arenilitoris]
MINSIGGSRYTPQLAAKSKTQPKEDPKPQPKEDPKTQPKPKPEAQRTEQPKTKPNSMTHAKAVEHGVRMGPEAALEIVSQEISRFADKRKDKKDSDEETD